MCKVLENRAQQDEERMDQLTNQLKEARLLAEDADGKSDEVSRKLAFVEDELEVAEDRVKSGEASVYSLFFNLFLSSLSKPLLNKKFYSRAARSWNLRKSWRSLVTAWNLWRSPKRRYETAYFLPNFIDVFNFSHHLIVVFSLTGQPESWRIQTTTEDPDSQTKGSWSSCWIRREDCQETPEGSRQARRSDSEQLSLPVVFLPRYLL